MNYSIEAFWRFSFYLSTWFIIPIDFALQSIRSIIDQSFSRLLQNNTNSSLNYSRESELRLNSISSSNSSGSGSGNTDVGPVFSPHTGHTLYESNHSDDRNPLLPLSSSSTFGDINQNTRWRHLNCPIQLSTLSLSYTFPYHHNYFSHLHRQQSGTSHILHYTGERRPSSSEARTIDAGHSTNHMPTESSSTLDSDSN
ncbi:unnamed protein product [Schistosoma turkestanicum]|nr:unnamed protein product [Schistosoma turkestanicum]